jgi:hypothetical protein
VRLALRCLPLRTRQEERIRGFPSGAQSEELSSLGRKVEVARLSRFRLPHRQRARVLVEIGARSAPNATPDLALTDVETALLD